MTAPYEAFEIAQRYRHSHSDYWVRQLAEGFCNLYLGEANDTPRPLTPIQLGILRFLAESIDANGYAPSFEEIASHCGYRSLATVHEHLTNLERKGWIARDYNESRAITVRHRPANLVAPLTEKLISSPSVGISE
jgi:DNA-binding MarR family transcriptional regulator